MPPLIYARHSASSSANSNGQPDRQIRGHDARHATRIQVINGVRVNILPIIPEQIIEIIKQEPSILESIKRLRIRARVKLSDETQFLDTADQARHKDMLQARQSEITAENSVPLFTRFTFRNDMAPVALSRKNIEPELFEEPNSVYYFVGSAKKLKSTWQEMIDNVEELLDESTDTSLINELSEVSKIDRHTFQNNLTILKTLFTKGVGALPQFDDTLKKHAEKLGRSAGVGSLTLEEKFECLSATGEYVHGPYICRCVGRRIIKFDYMAWIADKKEKDTLISRSHDNSGSKKAIPTHFDASHFRLNVAAHKIACLILHLAFIQGRLDGNGVVLSKRHALKCLGFQTKDRFVYAVLGDAIDSLRFIGYVMYQPEDKNIQEIGRFINSTVEYRNRYIVNVNLNFIGCVTNFGKKGAGKTDFQRGYFSWSPIVLWAARNYNTCGYLLAQLLVSDSGNHHFNDSEYRVIAYKPEVFFQKLQIHNQQFRKKFKSLLDAIRNLANDGIILHTEPHIRVLESSRPQKFEAQTIKLYVRRDRKMMFAELIKKITKVKS
jgi:hypothetical protein